MNKLKEWFPVAGKDLEYAGCDIQGCLRGGQMTNGNKTVCDACFEKYVEVAQ